jgi:hypothetical protein
VLTVADFERQLELKLLPLLASAQGAHASSLRVGGLRAGWGQTAREELTLRGYSYVPGVSVSGRFAGGEDVLHISGPAAARGTLRVGAQESLTGTLGGVAVHAGAEAVRADSGASAARLSSAVTSAEAARLKPIGLLSGG